MQEENGLALTPEQWDSAVDQAVRCYRSRRDAPGKVWKAEEEIDLVLPDFILKGVIDLVVDRGDSVEILDYKTGPKPDISVYPERIDHYRRQLELYAYLAEQRFGRKVSRMHLYYTSEQKGDPMITFPWEREAIQRGAIQILDDATIASMKEKRARDKARDEERRRKEAVDIGEQTDWQEALRQWQEWERR